jgi:hypothetical protein
MTVQRLLMPLVLVALVMLTACSSVGLRDVQSAVNMKNVYEGSTVKEEVVWKIRSIYGH